MARWRPEGTFVLADSPYFNQVRVIGHTSAGRWLSIAMEELSGERYRPITGWHATDREVRRYLEEEG